MVRVAISNLHAGIDGWGRDIDIVSRIVQVRPDLLICPETWRGSREDLYDELRVALGMSGAFAVLAQAERARATTGGRSWQPWHSLLSGEHGLYFTEHRPLSASQLARRQRVDLEPGEWGLSLLTRLPILSLHVEPIGRLPRERVNRAVIVATLEADGRAFRVIALHGAHISHGSHRQYQRISQLVASLSDDLPVLLAGDFNSWRPLLRAFLPGWRSLVHARTWPARRPHSQIDHVLGRGPWRATSGGALDVGSDHRLLYADLELERP